MPNPFDNETLRALASLTTMVPVHNPLADLQESMRERAEELAAAADAKMASGFRERLMRRLIEFQNKLAANEEVGAVIAVFGGTVEIHVTDIGYSNPALIVVHGTNDKGQPVELVQHMTQLSLLLVPVMAQGEPRRIGFTTESDIGSANSEE